MHHAAVCGMRDRGANEACRVQLEQVLCDLTESWREWRSTVSWMLCPQIQLRPAEEREHRHLPNAGLSSTQLLAAFEQSARTQQVRLETLFASIQQEYASLCYQDSLPVDLSFLPLIPPAPVVLLQAANLQPEEEQP